MQQFLTDRLHVVYRPGNANDAMERLVAQQRDVLPEVALFDSMVKDAVAITPETRKVDPTTKEHCRRFAESRLFFHLQCLADGDAEEDRLLEHYDHHQEYRRRRERQRERELDARDRKQREERALAASLGKHAPPHYKLASTRGEVERLGRRMARQESALKDGGRDPCAAAHARVAPLRAASASPRRRTARGSRGMGTAWEVSLPNAEWARNRFGFRERVHEAIQRREAEYTLRLLTESDRSRSRGWWRSPVDV